MERVERFVEEEQEAAKLLKRIRAFAAGSGVLSPRREWRVRQREVVWEQCERECLELGSLDLWEEMDWVAEQCGLTPNEKAVLAMARLESYTHQEIAAQLGVSERRVSYALAEALRKARERFADAASPRSLFWEEVRQKSRCLYRPRPVRWLR